MSDVERIANAVLYEGYLLWPYRRSAKKNKHRFSFGGLEPGCGLRCEVPYDAPSDAELSVTVRFLQPVQRRIDRAGVMLEEARIGDSDYYAAEEALERSFSLGPVWIGERRAKETLTSAAASVTTPLGEGLSWRRDRGVVHGELRVAIEERKIVVAFDNCCDDTLHAAHVILRLRGGRFTSLTDAPEEIRTQYKNQGVWPVLVANDVVLGSPIILSDFPRVAPQSADDTCDATENDELLMLSTLALPEAERHEAAQNDRRAQAIIARAEALDAAGQQRLHGISTQLAPGSKVRLKPNRRADVLDLALSGKTATVLSVEQDSDDRRFVTVALDDDPGRDLARFLGHRFFFTVDEVELLG